MTLTPLGFKLSIPNKYVHITPYSRGYEQKGKSQSDNLSLHCGDDKDKTNYTSEQEVLCEYHRLYKMV
jgi:hypothetical protein